MVDDEARVPDAILAAHALQIALPALAVGRVGEHEVELAGAEGVVGERRVLGSAHKVIGGVAIAGQQQIGLGDGVGLGVDLLAVEVGGDLLALRDGQMLFLANMLSKMKRGTGEGKGLGSRIAEVHNGS